jgi:hypothetical protein
MKRQRGKKESLNSRDLELAQMVDNLFPFASPPKTNCSRVWLRLKKKLKYLHFLRGRIKEK